MLYHPDDQLRLILERHARERLGADRARLVKRPDPSGDTTWRLIARLIADAGELLRRPTVTPAKNGRRVPAFGRPPDGGGRL